MKNTTQNTRKLTIQRQNNKIFSIILLIVGGLCLAGALKHLFYPTKGIVRYEDYRPVTGILTKPPQEVSYRGNRHIKLALDKYPDTDFDISPMVLREASRMVMAIDSADTVTVMLNKDDAQLLLSGKPNDDCRVYGLYKNNTPYILLADYLRAAEHDRAPALLFCVLGISIMAVGLRYLYKAYEPVTTTA
jgi:hypothetical protein